MIKGTNVPAIILCDQAFPMSSNLQKPFPNAQRGSHEAVLNYNLSKTRSVGNGFRRLKACFHFMIKRMECKQAEQGQTGYLSCLCSSKHLWGNERQCRAPVGKWGTCIGHVCTAITQHRRVQWRRARGEALPNNLFLEEGSRRAMNDHSSNQTEAKQAFLTGHCGVFKSNASFCWTNVAVLVRLRDMTSEK